MSEQELDLFEVSSGFAAELGAGSSQIVPREFPHPGLSRVMNGQAPDRLLVPDLFSFDVAGPGDGPDTASLAGEIGKDPAGFPLLKIIDVQPKKLCPPQTAAQQ